MFVSRDEVQTLTGRAVDARTVALAQLMIETWCGKDESEVTDDSDREVLARATTFQAVYIMTNIDDVLEQAAVKSLSSGEGSTTFDTDMFAPYISPWAVRACEKLSWFGTKSVNTGPVFDRPNSLASWRWTHL